MKDIIDEVINECREFANDHRVGYNEGGTKGVRNRVEDDAAQRLFGEVSMIKPKVILEVGTGWGYSALWMAKAAVEYGGRIITIDFGSEATMKANEFFIKAGVSNIVTALNGDARQLIPALKAYKFDMIILDAEKTMYKEFIELAEPMMSQGTVILSDNVIDRAADMKDFLDYVRTDGKYKSTLIETEDGLERTVRL